MKRVGVALFLTSFLFAPVACHLMTPERVPALPSEIVVSYAPGTTAADFEVPSRWTGCAMGFCGLLTVSHPLLRVRVSHESWRPTRTIDLELTETMPESGLARAVALAYGAPRTGRYQHRQRFPTTLSAWCFASRHGFEFFVGGERPGGGGRIERWTIEGPRGWLVTNRETHECLGIPEEPARFRLDWTGGVWEEPGSRAPLIAHVEVVLETERPVEHLAVEPGGRWVVFAFEDDTCIRQLPLAPSGEPRVLLTTEEVPFGSVSSLRWYALEDDTDVIVVGCGTASDGTLQLIDLDRDGWFDECQVRPIFAPGRARPVEDDGVHYDNCFRW